MHGETKPEQNGVARGPSRRNLVKGGAAAILAAAATARIARAADEHEHHDLVAGRAKSTAPAASPHAVLLEALEDCLAKARICVAHCHQRALAGDGDLAECAFAVDQMLRVCDTTAFLAATDSKLLAAMRPVCRAACEDCEKACRVHEDHHRACRECAEACAALLAELEKSV
jgi:Cys-rich four helix bundle protein (predicted Tat secretion target)